MNKNLPVPDLSRLAGFALAIFLSLGSPANAQTSSALYATVFSVAGDPQIRSTSGEIRPAVLGGRVSMGETVTSDADDRLQLAVNGPAGEDWGVLCPGPASEFVLDQYDLAAPPAQSRLQYLVVRFFQLVTAKITSWNPDRFAVPTKHTVIGIRGTEFQLDFLPEDSLTVTLWEGGPLDLYGGPDWEGFDDALFSDPSQKGVETMLVQEFADAAALAGLGFLEYLSGGPPILSLTDPATMAVAAPEGITGPFMATGSPAVCVPEPTWNVATVAFFGAAIGVWWLRRTRTSSPPARD